MAHHVLIVEDDPVTSLRLSQALRAWGYILALPSSAAVALRRARRHPPQLVLLGGLAPRGLAFDLRLTPCTWHVPLVRLAPATKAGLELEADEHVAAPLDLDELRRAIERALARAAERQRQGTRVEARFRMRSDARHLEELNDKLATLFHAAGLPILRVQQLALAVRELVANAIEWGHRNQPDKPVSVVCRADAERVTVDVRDSGPGFNPRDLPHAARADSPLAHLPVRAACNLRDGGFGILMAGGLVDELGYNDSGNEARLVMRFASARCRGGAVAQAR